MRIFKTLLLCLILLLLVLPALQRHFNLFDEKPLKGFYSKSEKPALSSFTPKGWFNGTFQDTLATRINEHCGFRNSLIRISNQYDYSLFSLIHAQGFVSGKNGMLYEEDYIHEYTGDFFIGHQTIDKKLARLKNVMDSLRSYNIPLILVYEPGKASFYPEYISRRFHPGNRSKNNYDYYIRKSVALGLPFIDLNRYFRMMKDTSRYPLFPKYGMHWSLYAVPLAVDTLVKTIEKTTSKTLPRFTSHLPSALPSFHPSTLSTPLGTDNDIGELLNLVCQPKRSGEVYPVIRFDTTSGRSLDALVIADSYYVNIVDTFGSKIFRKQDYWYYNNKLYPYQNNNPPVYVDKSELRSKLLGYQVILLMVSEINLHCGFWNFADEAYLAFHPEVKDSWVYQTENMIRNEREWFRFMVNKARLEKRTLEEMIHGDARYVVNSDPAKFPSRCYQDSIYQIAGLITNSADWYESVKKKAAERNIPVDSMVMIDARYTHDTWKKAR